MKGYPTRTLAAALVLAIPPADCIGAHVAQVRPDRIVPVFPRQAVLADATAVKDNWRPAGRLPQAQRAFADTVT
jgi:hypothetical protein